MNVSPSTFRRYLRQQGWDESESPNKRAWIFVARHDGQSYELALPKDQASVDYERRARELLEVLAHRAKSSVSRLEWSLANPTIDLIQFSIQGLDTRGGTAALDKVVTWSEARKTMLLAAAHSVVEPLPYFARMSRNEPLAFLSKCRERAPREGSFVSEVIVPIAPSIGDQPDLEDPYARKVTSTLCGALGVAMESLCEGDDGRLVASSRLGISGNLLHALAGLEPPSLDGCLQIDFSWSPLRAMPATAHSRLRFEPDVFGAIQEAARLLKEKSPSPDFEVEGYVAQLVRDDVAPDSPGEVAIAADIRGRVSKVYMTLAAKEYEQAIDAHKAGQRVRARGLLTSQGRKQVLAATEFHVVQDDSTSSM